MSNDRDHRTYGSADQQPDASKSSSWSPAQGHHREPETQNPSTERTPAPGEIEDESS